VSQTPQPLSLSTAAADTCTGRTRRRRRRRRNKENTNRIINTTTATMGIMGQGTCLYSSRELKGTNIYHVVHEQYRLKTTINDTTPTITNQQVVIDANPVGYPFIFKAVGTAKGVVSIAKNSLKLTLMLLLSMIIKTNGIIPSGQQFK